MLVWIHVLRVVFTSGDPVGTSGVERQLLVKVPDINRRKGDMVG